MKLLNKTYGLILLHTRVVITSQNIWVESLILLHVNAITSLNICAESHLCVVITSPNICAESETLHRVCVVIISPNIWAESQTLHRVCVVITSLNIEAEHYFHSCVITRL